MKLRGRPAGSLARVLRAMVTALVMLGTMDVLLGMVTPAPERNFLYDSDPYLFWRMRANVRDFAQYSEEPGHERTVTHISTNALGIRNEELPRKAAGEFRILVMGDSSIFGHGVELAQTFECRLEALLRRRHPHRLIRVVNGGVSGYSSFQGRIWFHELAPRVQPDLVILGYYFSDFIPDVMPDAARVPPGAARSSVMRALARSNLYQLLRDELTRFALRQADRTQGKSLVARVTVDDYGKNLQAMMDEAATLKAACLLLLLDPRAVSLPAAQKPYRGAATALAKERGVPLVDMEGPFSRASDRRALFLDAVHPSPAGDRIIAAALEQAIERSRLLAPRARRP